MIVTFTIFFDITATPMPISRFRADATLMKVIAAADCRRLMVIDRYATAFATPTRSLMLSIRHYFLFAIFRHCLRYFDFRLMPPYYYVTCRR